MPIDNISAEELSGILKSLLTPSKEISTPERLFGRSKSLTEIERAFNSDGRHVFIYGDRGVGKTSLAVTAAYLHNSSKTEPIYVPCGDNTNFGDTIQAIGIATLPLQDRLQQRSSMADIGIGVPGVAQLKSGYSKKTKTDVPKPTNVIEALDILRLAGSDNQERRVVVIDEFDRVRNDKDKVLFSELIKNASTSNTNIRFIFCGIGRSVEEILGAHPSSGRYFEPLCLEKLHHNFLWDIINQVSIRTEVKIPQEIMLRIGIVSDGFPHFVHLIGQCMFWAMHDDPDVVTTCKREHYNAGIKGALQKTEPALRLAWQKATEKTKNKTQYEEALWALADKAETRRQVSDIYERSYKRIMLNRSGKLLDQPKFNSRLLTLRKPSHGEIVVGYGSGYFAFRENVLRGYARLKAEDEGIPLTPDPS